MVDYAPVYKDFEGDDATRFLADKAVVSTIDIHQAFLKYVGEEKLEPEFTDMVSVWQWEKWSLCDLHLAVAEPPEFKTSRRPDPGRTSTTRLSTSSVTKPRTI